MDIPILGTQENLKPKLGGADEHGIVEDGPMLLSQLLKLMDKARFAMAGSAANMGCIEHRDPMIYATAFEIVGLFVFARALEDVSAELAISDDEVKNFTTMLAYRCSYHLSMMTKYVMQLKGFSDKAKKEFIRDTKEFLIQTMAKNCQGFSNTVASIIQS